MDYTITRGSVSQHASELLRTHLRLRDFSPACTVRVMLSVLFCACSRLCTITAACFALVRAPSRETIRKAILRHLPARDELLRRVNRALTADVPRALRRREQQVSIDLVLIPYHGEPMLDLSEVFRSQAKSGTSHFHAYATAYVNYRGQRYTLALTTVERGEKMQDVLKRLFRRLSQLGIRVRMLLLDRGFWSVAVIRYLQAGRHPFLMPVVLRGRKDDHPKGPSGTRVFAIHKRGGWDEYTLTAADKQTARVCICIHCRNYNGQWDRHGRQTLVYAFWGLEPSSTNWVRETYRKRFAIESSYRQMHQGRARTSTRNPLVRLLLVAIALILRNVWVWLHYAVLSTPRRGNCRLNLERLPLKTLLLWLQHQAEDELGRMDQVPSERPMPQTVAS
jgi:Transposase DDE domain